MTRLKTLLVGLCALVCAAGCAGETGKLTLKLTDAPGDFKKAVVTIDRIYLAGDEAGEADGELAAEGGGAVVLLDTPVTTDLLTLANSTADLVKDAEVPAGRYSQLRFVISGGYVEVEQADGSSRIYASSATYVGLPEGARVDGSLQMPSYAQSGLKVNIDGGLDISGEQKVLLVDFNVAESFGQVAGRSGLWVMTPVIQAGDITASGSVRATLVAGADVSLPQDVTLGGFQAVLGYTKQNADGTTQRVEEKLALVDADADGTFEAHFQWLFPRAFELSFEAPAGVAGFTTDPGSPAAVTVVSGQAQVQAFTLTQVQ